LALAQIGHLEGRTLEASSWQAISAEGVLLLGEQVLGGLHHILRVCGVVELWLVGSDLAGAAVLGASDLFLNKGWLLLSSRLRSGLLGELIDGLLVVHLATAVLVDARLQRSVAGTSNLCGRHVEYFLQSLEDVTYTT